LSGSPPKRGDVVLNPAERGELIEESPVVRCAVDVPEALESAPVIRTDNDRAGFGHR
jgi:hypothetical protein